MTHIVVSQKIPWLMFLCLYYFCKATLCPEVNFWCYLFAYKLKLPSLSAPCCRLFEAVWPEAQELFSIHRSTQLNRTGITRFVFRSSLYVLATVTKVGGTLEWSVGSASTYSTQVSSFCQLSDLITTSRDQSFLST